MNIEKLIESYKKAIKECCTKGSKVLKEEKEVKFTVEGQEVIQIYRAGFIVPDIDDESLVKWIKINYLVNLARKRDKILVDEKLKELGL